MINRIGINNFHYAIKVFISGSWGFNICELQGYLRKFAKYFVIIGSHVIIKKSTWFVVTFESDQISLVNHMSYDHM